MNGLYIQKIKIFIALLLILFISLVLYSCKNIKLSNNSSISSSISDIEKDYINQRAISTVMAMYLGKNSYIEQESQNKIPDEVSNRIKDISNKSIDRISISNFSILDNNIVLVDVEVYECPFKTVIFYGLKYRRINNAWLLENIDFDA